MGYLIDNIILGKNQEDRALDRLAQAELPDFPLKMRLIGVGLKVFQYRQLIAW